MKIIVSKNVLLVLFFLCTNSLSAQNDLNAGGGDVSNETMKFSYSIGQVSHVAISHSECYVTQGVQHPILTVLDPTYAEDIQDMGRIIQLYPNPVSTDIHIALALLDEANVKVRLFDINGKLCLVKSLKSKENSISLFEYQAGIYILRIFENENENENEIYKSKIIKD